MVLTNFFKDKFDGKVIYRHELKYQINLYQQEVLKIKLPKIMSLDPHVSFGNQYKIRSLYFDDIYNTCYMDNENGTDPREKFRIRIYNGSDERISLELKRKESGKTLKQSCLLTPQTTRLLMSGGLLKWQSDMHPLLKKLYVLQQTKYMKPKIIVEYDRIPFVSDNNVRITLDLNVKASSDIPKFLDKTINGRPIMPIGANLLEVKYNSFLPDAIYETIQMNNLSLTTYSKYYLCRKFGGLI